MRQIVSLRCLRSIGKATRLHYRLAMAMAGGFQEEHEKRCRKHCLLWPRLDDSDEADSPFNRRRTMYDHQPDDVIWGGPC